MALVKATCRDGLQNMSMKTKTRYIIGTQRRAKPAKDGLSKCLGYETGRI